jgi:steroid delta-isomerase-like uncharacterized protein
MGQASDIVSQYFAALSAGDVDSAVALVAEDGDFRTPMGSMAGRQAISAYLGAFESAFPKAQYELTAVVESGNAVAAEGTYKATHKGPMMMPDGSTLAATGREVSAPFVTMFDVDGGAIVSHRPYWDLAGFMAQLTA